MVEKDKVCGKEPQKYGLKCCVAYVPEGLRGHDVLGIPIVGAEDKHHRHLGIMALIDGTLLSYCWGGRSKKETWAMMPKGRGSMEGCTRAEWEKALAEIGRRPRSEK